MKIFLKKYLVSATDATHIQFFRYIFVGGVATIFDMATFYIFRNIFGFHYLVAQTTGFLLGLSVNYAISIIWVFRSSGNFKKELFFFAIIGVGGLILSYVILWILIDVLGMNYFQDMLAKTIAVFLVLVWNFGMRKYFVFKN